MVVYGPQVEVTSTGLLLVVEVVQSPHVSVPVYVQVAGTYVTVLVAHLLAVPQLPEVVEQETVVLEVVPQLEVVVCLTTGLVVVLLDVLVAQSCHPEHSEAYEVMVLVVHWSFFSPEQETEVVVDDEHAALEVVALTMGLVVVVVVVVDEDEVQSSHVIGQAESVGYTVVSLP